MLVNQQFMPLPAICQKRHPEQLDRVHSQGTTDAADALAPLAEERPIVDRSNTASPESLARDLKTLARFIEVHCTHKHPDAEKESVALPGFDMDRLAKPGLALCPDCRKLLAHAFVKRAHCPMHPKPACKHCPNHCYHPRYRAEIREVMKFSGRHLVLHGRVDYLAHLLF
jgi:hypothetical protein